MSKKQEENDIHELPFIHYEVVKMVGDITSMTRKFTVSGNTIDECYATLKKMNKMSEDSFKEHE